MKKGFIEMIENNKVLVIYEDFTQEEFDLSIFPKDIKIDMNVVINDGKVIEVSPPSEELKQEIKEITSRLFVPFKERKKR